MIYVDTPFRVSVNHPTAPRCFRGRLSAHLMADSDEELLAYARSIGMRPSWIQKPGTPRSHFDVTGSRLTRALGDSKVRKLSLLETVDLLRSRFSERRK